MAGMKRERNVLPWVGFAVCLAALVSYPFFFARFPATRDLPWVNWLLFALGLGLVGMGVSRAFRAPERFRGRVAGPVLGALSLAILAGFLFLTVFYSRQLPAAAGAPRVGAKAPDFILPDAQGRPVRLSQVLTGEGGAPGTWVLLIFYRGYW